MWNRCLNSGETIFPTHAMPSIIRFKWSDGERRARENSFVPRSRFSCAIFGDENVKLSSVAKERCRDWFKCSHRPGVNTSPEKIKYFHLRRHFWHPASSASSRWMDAVPHSIRFTVPDAGRRCTEIDCLFMVPFGKLNYVSMFHSKCCQKQLLHPPMTSFHL